MCFPRAHPALPNHAVEMMLHPTQSKRTCYTLGKNKGGKRESQCHSLLGEGHRLVTSKKSQKDMDSRGIEPRTTPMLREYYTTKPQAQSYGKHPSFSYYHSIFLCGQNTSTLRSFRGSVCGSA